MCVWLNLENRFGRKIPCYLPNRFSIKNPITEKTTEQALNPPALHWLVDLGSSGEEEELRRYIGQFGGGGGGRGVGDCECTHVQRSYTCSWSLMDIQKINTKNKYKKFQKINTKNSKKNSEKKLKIFFQSCVMCFKNISSLGVSFSNLVSMARDIYFLQIQFLDFVSLYLLWHYHNNYK